jgi:hypothetical protein
MACACHHVQLLFVEMGSPELTTWAICPILLSPK